MNKICPRCSAPFVCRVDQISLCNCKKVVLKEVFVITLKLNTGIVFA